MEWRTLTYALIFVVWSGVDAIQVTIPQKVYERARGDNISLPCTFRPDVQNPPIIVITWTIKGIEGDTEDLVILTHYHPQETTDVQATYEDRASLDVDIATGKASLQLNSITLADNKEFECHVQIPRDTRGTPAATTRLVVLVAPSKPICKVQGRQEYGQNINLTCHSEEGSPTPTYKWESRDVQNQRRPPEPRTIEKGGLLSLFNISRETSGFYICTSTNKIRSASCNITVAVMPPSMNLGSTAGIIGAVIAFLVVVAIIIGCCCYCKKKKNKEQDYAMGKSPDIYEDDPNRDDEQDDSNPRVAVKDPVERRENYGENSERQRKDYDDRRSDYDDRRSDYDDRRSDYNDRRSDYNDRRDNDDRRSDYDDRRSDYNDRRNDYDDRRSDYNDRRERYDDDRNYDDRRDRR